MSSWLDLWSGTWADLWGIEAPDIFAPDSTYYNTLVEIYNDTDLVNMVDIIHARLEPTTLDEIRGNGAGSFKVSKRDPKVATNPSLLDYRKYVKIRLNGAVIGGFVIQTKRTIIVGEGEEADEMWEISGEGPRSWSRDAAVYPSKGLKATSADTRYFNFATERGSWYNPTDWKVPVKSYKYLQTGNWWKTAPAEWPDAPNTYWVWDRNTYAMPQGFVYFRHEFTVPTAAAHSLFVAVDDQGEIYIDGELLMTTSEHAWQETNRVDFDLQPGTHVIGIKAYNFSASNPGGLMAALFKYGDPLVPTSAQLLSQTGNGSEWLCNPYPTVEPGWTIGDILTTLLDEAKTRGVRFANNWVPTFTQDVDSSGAGWGNPVPMSFTVGATYQDVISSIEELGADIYVNPDTMKMSAWAKRGKDRSVETNTDAAIIFSPGHNLVSADETGQAEIANTLMLFASDGWTEKVVDTADSDSVAKYGRVETQMSTQLSATASAPLIKELFRQKSLPEKSATFEIVPVPDMIPYLDFNVGDLVSAPGEVPGVYETRRVMSISFAEDEQTGLPHYALEFDTIFKDRQSELEKWLSRVSNSSALGGGFTNSTSTPSTTIHLPPGSALGSVPDAPTGLTVSTVGHYSPSGESSSDFGLTWNPVVTGAGFGSVTVSKYEVWGRLSTQTESQLMGTVFDTFAYFTGFRPGDIWDFKVRAVSESGGPGDFCAEVELAADAPDVPLLPPSAPTLSSAFGTVTVKWDGLLGGQPAPAYLRYIRVERALDVAGPWTAIGTLVNYSMNDMPGVTGTTFWYRLVAVDPYGVSSTPGAASSVVVLGISSADITGALPSSNLILNGSFEDNLTGWIVKQTYGSGSSALVQTGGMAGAKYLQMTRGTETTEVELVVAQSPANYIPVAGGDPFGYYVSARANGPAQLSDAFTIRVFWYLDDRTTPASTSYSDGVVYQDIGLLPGLYVGQVFPPVDARYMQVGLVLGTPQSTINVDDVVARQVLTSEQIADGAISAVHMSAGSITANALAAGSVTADALAANSIIAEKIAAGEILVSHLAPSVGDSIDITANESINFLVTKTGDLEDNLTDTTSTVNDITTYYNFTSEGAVIGQTDSAFKLWLKNDQIQIVENGAIISYWDSGQLVVDKFVGEEVVLGNHKLMKYTVGTVVKAI